MFPRSIGQFFHGVFFPVIGDEINGTRAFNITIIIMNCMRGINIANCAVEFPKMTSFVRDDVIYVSMADFTWIYSSNYSRQKILECACVNGLPDERM